MRWFVLAVAGCEVEPEVTPYTCVPEVEADDCHGTPCERCTIDREGDVPDDVWFQCLNLAEESQVGWVSSNRDRDGSMTMEPHEYDVEDLVVELECWCDVDSHSFCREL